MRKIFAVLLGVAAIGLAGCTTPGAFKDLTPQQIDAVVKDKSVFSNCTVLLGPGWTAKSSTLTVDRGVIVDGNITIDSNTCGQSYTTNRAPARTITPNGPLGAGNTVTTTVVAPTTTTIQTPGHTITERPQ